MDFGREVEDVAEFGGPKSHDGGQGHAVHVAAGRGLGRIDVAVRVNPEQSDLLVLPAIEFGNARYRSGRDGMVSAKHERDLAGFKSLENKFGALGAGGGDFFQVFRVGGAFLLLFGNGDGDVAAVFDVVAERLRGELPGRQRARRRGPCRRRGGTGRGRAGLR